ncbi:Z1 domain-containing protein [Burkholderia multivorans]|uniref:Z1 domain-containing protein n=1 Tax=Burkholderia multivorans TaxID=87883 RepID=UPI000ACD0951|nr:Z1 domain-containing protein [Burkholderia multivorans]MBU9256457.1 Z1 domain-containing protein [Burkholderia multivorans]MDN7758430.1 Z1 domain-containing protein [Burkholderia multivorans]MDN8103477.1 Z1 domain-containing protein [Burkholderia multivorans]
MGSEKSTLGPVAIVPFEGAPASQKEFNDTQLSGDVWWQRYRSSLVGRLSPTALSVLEADAQYIIEKALPHNKDGLDLSAWPDSRVRTGMVVGSVQSGKTASMLGVAAKALDAGVDLLVLLAGTRVSLWLQTYERFLAQLDGSTADSAYRRRNERLILPQPADVLFEQRADPARYLQRPLARQALRAGRPIICIVPKEDEHLLTLRRFLLDVVTDDYLVARDRPYSILLLDDEADDASVLDSAKSQKITPRLITALWSGDPDEASTRHSKMVATYVAYTATPQANYLQATHNPLSPRDFNAALRTPGMTGSVTPRSTTYAEASGVRSYYCGGDIFYERFRLAGDGALCQASVFPNLRLGETEVELNERREALRWTMLSDALRCYFVGAAVRSLGQGWENAFDHERIYSTAEAARVAACDAHTMLIHPSARKEDHFSTAIDVVRWASAEPGCEAKVQIEDEAESLQISADALARRLLLEEAEWSAWVGRFEASRMALATLPQAPYVPISVSEWPMVREALITRIFPNVRLRVLNSDPGSTDRPRFEVEADGNGFRIPADSLSIFVAGNVLSRGLTLEGLTTSLFLRGAAEPAADTQMQMQRWFGYRGSFLPYCRLFTYDDQLQLFRRYHANDNALKTELISSMDGGGEDNGPALVLQGASFVATSKVDARKVPLSPGPRPSIRLVETEDDDLAKHNIDVAVGLLDDGEWVPLRDGNGLQRGLIRSTPVGLRRLAEVLDMLRYSHHDPQLGDELSLRWGHYARLLAIDEPLFRPPMHNPQPYGADPQSCPYSIAAYLRLWAHLTSGRSAPGLYPTDRPEVPWNYSDATQPGSIEFYLAFRTGQTPARDPRLAARGVHAVTRERTESGRALQTLWGTRGYGGTYYGDEFVDYCFHGTRPVPSIQGGATWRPRGHPGLALFHVVSAPELPNDLLAVGLGVPHGGPDHIAALRI